MQWTEYYYIDSVDCWHFIDKRILLEWQDREEIVETKDWIDECLDEFRKTTPHELREDWYRKILEQHAPKVKKVNQEEIDKRYYWNKFNDVYRFSCDIHMLECFAKDHWLLEE